MGICTSVLQIQAYEISYRYVYVFYIFAMQLTCIYIPADSNKDTVCSPNHIELYTNLPLN